MLALGQERSQSGLELQAARPLVQQAERAPNAMIASTHPLATQTGLNILRQGGNAVDAAVAMAFVLAVVHPEAGNLGGGGYILVRMADGRMTAIDYKETTPAAARDDAFPPGQRHVGYKTAGVPGTVAGMEMVHSKLGRMAWSKLLEPARKMARDGIPASQRIELILPLQVPVMKQFQETAKVFLHGNGMPLRQGEIFRQTDLAATIRRIQKRGAKEFYEGETARRIAADMEANGGFMTARDLAGYRAIERVPLETNYRGYTVLTMPPSSGGGQMVVEALNILENFELGLGSEGSSRSLHLIAEALRRARRDRVLYNGDPAFKTVPVEVLSSKSYAHKLAAAIQTDRATPNPEYPPIGGMATAPAGEPHFESFDTTHFSIVDREGNLVANTYTLGNFYGSQVMPKGTGVLLGDMVGGLMAGRTVQSPPRLKAGMRMNSMMMPTVILRPGGSTWIALGSPGASTIPSTLLQVILNLIDFKMSLRDAIEFPRIHFENDRIEAEPAALIFDAAEKLRLMGHNIEPRLRSQGDVHAVMIENQGGMKQGWADGRRGGRAEGY